MRKVLSAAAAAALLSIAAPASAQTFIGYANGCFTTTSCTPSSTFQAPIAPGSGGNASVGGLFYTTGQVAGFGFGFNQTIVAGNLSLGGTSDGLGYFTLAPSNFTYDGQMFNLLVTFLAPPATDQAAFVAELAGTVTNNPNGGGVFIDFANNSDNPLMLNSSAGTYQFWVNDVDISSASTLQILSGHIRAVPEPATWGMMLLGFLGMGMVMRRRRSPVLAQIA